MTKKIFNCPHYNTGNCKASKAKSPDTGIPGIELCRYRCSKCCVEKCTPHFCVRISDMNAVEKLVFYNFANKEGIKGF